MRNFNIKKVLSNLKDKINAQNIAIFAIIIIIIGSGLFLYQNHIKIENLKKELLKISNEDKKLIDYKNKVLEVQEKIRIGNQKKKELEIEILKNLDFEECFKKQIERVINQQESLIDYCEEKEHVQNIVNTGSIDYVPEVSKTITKEYKFYFTNYDLGDVNQNDSTPCIGASGKDLCYLHSQGINTLALVNIKRKEMGISFGDKVELIGGPCEGIYQVEDEMNIRFRQKTPIYKPGTNFEIRGDIARYGHKLNCGGNYIIKKVL